MSKDDQVYFLERAVSALVRLVREDDDEKLEMVAEVFCKHLASCVVTMIVDGKMTI